jgi:DASH complex subunit ASK1
MDNDDSILADSDSDSLDEVNNTAHPSAAFLMVSQRQAGPDDSFGSSNHSDDSLIAEEAANLGIAPVHPFARGMDGPEFEADDSFDDDSLLVGGSEPPEETLFGVPPAARLRAEQLRAAGQGQLHLPGQELLEDTMGIGAQFARTGQVEETPTPAFSWDRRQA